MNTQGEIRIIPCGAISDGLLSEVAHCVGEAFDSAVGIGDLQQPCGSFYNRQRGQYSAEGFLESLAAGGHARMTLCITDVDLYIPELNYVFGLADKIRGLSVVSSARFMGRGGREAGGLVLDRVVKTSVHELGHTYGLAHCRNPKCVMFYSFNVSDTDYKGRELCGKCRKKLLKLSVGGAA